MELKSGHEVIYSTEEENKKLRKCFPFDKEGTIKLYPGGWHLFPGFLKYADRIYDFKHRSSDVIIMTCPKSGTTWTQEIIWTMMHNADFKNDSANTKIGLRSPFLELDFLYEKGINEGTSVSILGIEESVSALYPGKNLKEDGIMLRLADKSDDPRIIKTHLPFPLLNPDMLDTCKVVYVARNPKDMCISYFHHSSIIGINKFMGDFDTFVDLFVNDNLLFSKFWEHIKEGWERRSHKNLHWVFYEEMKINPIMELKRLNAFLETNLSDQTLQKILVYTKFDNMQKRNIENTAVSQRKFYRKGITGDWKSHLNDEQNEKIEKWIEEHLEGIPFTY